jgi:radical SAM-linked protein
MGDARLVLIKFKVQGNLRFLSHAEMLKVFQRACVRAGIKIQYSQGFNPRPKLSLPLPRSVGVETDEDLLCLRVARDPNESRVANHESRIKAELSEQLPNSLSIVDCRLSIVNGKSPIPKPCQATYVITVRQEYINDELKARIRRLLASESLNLQRRIDTKNSKFKNVDVRPFLKSIEFDNNRGIVVECKISSAGTIRVEEILKLLELDVEKLAMPIRRTNVQWQKA